MSRSIDSKSSNMRVELASECSIHHNNELKCNNTNDNGTQCIYKPGGIKTAPRCSPMTKIRNRLSDSISSGKYLSRKDILDMKKVRARDKKHLEKLRSQVIKSKDKVKQQHVGIDNLLRTLKLEKQNCREAISDLKQKTLLGIEKLRNKQRSLKENYELQIQQIKNDFEERLQNSNRIEDGRNELQQLIRKNHKSKIAEIRISCDVEKSKLQQEVDNRNAKFSAVKSELDRKNKQIVKDEQELKEQRKITRKRLIDIKQHEVSLKQHIREFNQSKREYNNLISELKHDKITLEEDKREVAELMNREGYITKMEQRVSDEMDIFNKKEDQFDIESASVMNQISNQIDVLDKARQIFNKEIVTQTRLLSKKEKTIKRRLETDIVSRNDLSHPELDKFKRPSNLTVKTDYIYDDIKRTKPKRVLKIVKPKKVSEESPRTPTSVEHEPVSPLSEPESPVTPTSVEHKPASPLSEPESPVSPTSVELEPVSPLSEPESPASPTSVEHKPVSPLSEPESPVSPTSIEHEPVSPLSEPESPVTPTSVEHKPASPLSEPESPVSPTSVELEPVSPLSEPESPASPTSVELEPVSPTPSLEEPVTPVSPTPTVEEPDSPLPSAPEGSGNELKELLDLLDSFLQAGGDFNQSAGAISKDKVNKINNYILSGPNNKIANKWIQTLKSLESFVVNKQYHDTLSDWLTKNVIKGRIEKFSLQMLRIPNDKKLHRLIYDDADSIEYREEEDLEKLTPAVLQKKISKATLYSTIPPALQKAPIVAKIYSAGYETIFSELEQFNTDEYKSVSENIIKLASDQQIDEEPSQDKVTVESHDTSEQERIAVEEEAIRVAAEEKAIRVASEEEAVRVAAEEEAARVAAEEEANRVATEEEAARVAAEEEAIRVAAEEEAIRVAAEEEAARVTAEEEAARVAAEEEAARVAAEETGTDSTPTADSGNELKELLDLLDSFLQAGGEYSQNGGAISKVKVNKINSYLSTGPNKKIAEQWEESLTKLQQFIVNKDYHVTLTDWIRKNVINGKIKNLNLMNLRIPNDKKLERLISDSPEAVNYREEEDLEKLTQSTLQKKISKATLYSTVPPALQKAPIVAKIYRSGFKKIFSELENFNKKEYTNVAKNI